MAPTTATRQKAVLKAKPLARPGTKPVIKWAGGKSKLLTHILPLLPAQIVTYREPFCGGAAVFFALSPSQRKRAVLCDQNQDLVALYIALRDDVDGLISALGHYRYDRKLFYKTRAVDPETLSPVERAARLVFLNKTCFNGLWRVNSKGVFNVPFGRYENPTILDEDVLRRAAAVLKGVRIEHGDFVLATKGAKAGDFVYFDPPYAPLSKTALFTAYATQGFGHADQVRLRDEFARLGKLGVQAVLSNHDTEEIRALYAGFRIVALGVRRSINSNIQKRGPARELLITTERI
jgi:DNA adenine methylase